MSAFGRLKTFGAGKFVFEQFFKKNYRVFLSLLAGASTKYSLPLTLALSAQECAVLLSLAAGNRNDSFPLTLATSLATSLNDKLADVDR